MFDGMMLLVDAKSPGLRRIANDIYHYYNAGVVTLPKGQTLARTCGLS